MKVQLKLKRIKVLDTSKRNETTALVLDNSKDEKNRARVKKWRQGNPDKYKEHLEYVKEWKRNNPDKVKETRKKYYEENRDWLLEYFKQYHRNKKKKEITKC